MARPKKQFPPKKEHRITIRMTEDMYFVVAREAERAGLSISDYFRQLVLHHKIIYKPPIIHDDRAIIEELKEINKLGNNLNQIARHQNQGGAMTDGIAKELREALQLITGSCLKINKAVEEEYR